MQIILPQCRQSLTAADFNYIKNTLASDARERESLGRILGDADMRDLVLDVPALADSLFTNPGKGISCRLYYYLHIRRELCRQRIGSRDVADYVAEVLATFTSWSLLRSCSDGEPELFRQLVEMSADSTGRSQEWLLGLRLQIGNCALILTGLHPGEVLRRSLRQEAPTIAYYENVGSFCFRAAANMPLCGEYGLERILRVLADDFRTMRVVLNTLHERALLPNSALPSDARVSRHASTVSSSPAA